MPMLPGYHFTALSLGGGHASWVAARLTSVLATLLLLAAAAQLWRRQGHEAHGRIAALLAALPLLHPFSAMAYTDALSVAYVGCVVYYTHIGIGWLAGLCLALAIATRQTNAVWGGWLLLTIFVQTWHSTRRFWPTLKTTLGRGWLSLAILTCGAGLVWHYQRVTLTDGHGNALQPNLATLHSAGHLLFLFFAPLLPLRWPHLKNTIAQCGGYRLWLPLFFAITTAFALTFKNAHIWNRDLWWPECKFTLLRNWPLVAIDKQPWLAWISGAILSMLILWLWAEIRQHRFKLEISAAVLCGIATLLTNGLVEPRYFLPTLVVGLMHAQFETKTYRVLLGWWVLLTLAHAPWIVTGWSLW